MTGYTLYDALTNVLPHTNGDDTVPTLNAVQVDVDVEGLVQFVATDRYTIGVVEAASHPKRELEPGTFLIPAANARDIAKFAKTVKGGCALIEHTSHVSPGVITTTLDTGSMIAGPDQLGDFPKWRSLWPVGADPVAVDRIGLGAGNLAKFGKLVAGGRAIKGWPTLTCTFYGAVKPFTVDVDLGYASELTMRALVMPVRLADKS